MPGLLCFPSKSIETNCSPGGARALLPAQCGLGDGRWAPGAVRQRLPPEVSQPRPLAPSSACGLPFPKVVPLSSSAHWAPCSCPAHQVCPRLLCTPTSSSTQPSGTGARAQKWLMGLNSHTCCTKKSTRDPEKGDGPKSQGSC